MRKVLASALVLALSALATPGCAHYDDIITKDAEPEQRAILVQRTQKCAQNAMTRTSLAYGTAIAAGVGVLGVSAMNAKSSSGTAALGALGSGLAVLTCLACNTGHIYSFETAMYVLRADAIQRHDSEQGCSEAQANEGVVGF